MQVSEQERLIKDLEIAIDRLGALYNQYFMGIERMEPAIPRKDVERKMNVLRKTAFQNTALRFRFQAQVSKYNTQSTYWRRICRQIEEGTYQRDLRRAKARTQVRDEADVAQNALDGLGEDITQETDTGLDLGDFMDGIDDPFGDGASLDDQIAAMTDLASKSVDERRAAAPKRSLDSVHPASGKVAAQRTSGVNIPVSSLKASQKMNKERPGPTVPPDAPPGLKKAAVTADNGETISTFFQRPSVGPPPPPSGASSGAKPPPPPPGASGPPPSPRGRPAAKPEAKPAARPARPPAAGGGVNDDKIKSVYRAYVAARKKTNEGTDNLSVDKVAKLLRKTDKAKGGVDDFKVVIRNGKAVIKTVKK